MECPICLAEIKTPKTMDCCNNTYCSTCIVEWVKVRNVCPLCCKATGTQQVNTLKLIKNEQFDDGFLILETEMKQIIDRLDIIKQRVSNKRNQLSRMKSVTSASLVSYLEGELRLMQVYRVSMEQQYLTHDRAGAVHSMQLITEGIIQLESSLKTNSALIEFDDDEDYLEDQSYGSDEDYFEYEVEVKYSRPNRFKTNVPAKLKNAERSLGT